MQTHYAAKGKRLLLCLLELVWGGKFGKLPLQKMAAYCITWNKCKISAGQFSCIGQWDFGNAINFIRCTVSWRWTKGGSEECVGRTGSRHDGPVRGKDNEPSQGRGSKMIWVCWEKTCICCSLCRCCLRCPSPEYDNMKIMKLSPANFQYLCWSFLYC